jgi:hypothetical protein
VPLTSLCSIGAAVLSHHVDDFSLVSGFFVFTIGCEYPTATRISITCINPNICPKASTFSLASYSVPRPNPNALFCPGVKKRKTSSPHPHTSGICQMLQHFLVVVSLDMDLEGRVRTLPHGAVCGFFISLMMMLGADADCYFPYLS